MKLHCCEMTLDFLSRFQVLVPVSDDPICWLFNPINMLMQKAPRKH